MLFPLFTHLYIISIWSVLINWSSMQYLDRCYSILNHCGETSKRYSKGNHTISQIKKDRKQALGLERKISNESDMSFHP